VHRRLQGEVKRKSSTWRLDQTFVRIAGTWMYLFRAVDSYGQARRSISFSPRRGTAKPPKPS
jgi:transposase-like protein